MSNFVGWFFTNVESSLANNNSQIWFTNSDVKINVIQIKNKPIHTCIENELNTTSRNAHTPTYKHTDPYNKYTSTHTYIYMYKIKYSWINTYLTERPIWKSLGKHKCKHSDQKRKIHEITRYKQTRTENVRKSIKDV